MANEVHKVYQALNLILPAFSDAESEQVLHARVKVIVAQLVLCGVITDGHWVGDVYCYLKEL
jgi:hypothetical protein